MMKKNRQKTILITGATDGLGKKIAEDVAKRGEKVVLHGRNPEKGRKVLDSIREMSGSENLSYYNADFASLKEVQYLAEKLLENFEYIDILINNAGVGVSNRGAVIREESVDGYELRFAVNYLAHFLLTHKILSLLKKAAAQFGEARIINVSSAGQQAIKFDDVMLTKKYNGMTAYCQSKLAQIMFTIDLAEELVGSGVTVAALHPATFMNTKMVYESNVTPMSTVEKGANAVEYLAFSDELKGVSGKYFDGKRRSRAIKQAYDKEARKQLQELSIKLTHLKDITL